MKSHITVARNAPLSTIIYSQWLESSSGKNVICAGEGSFHLKMIKFDVGSYASLTLNQEFFQRLMSKTNVEGIGVTLSYREQPIVTVAQYPI